MKTSRIIKKFVAKDGRQVVLRTPKWDDLDDFLDLINSLVGEADILWDKKMTREQEADWLGKYLADMEKGKTFGLIAEVEGKAVANSTITKKDGYRKHVGGVGIAIKDGFRDIGIGTEMLKILVRQAEKMDLKMLTLGVLSTNMRAKHVYEKVGFKETGRIPREVFKNGKFIDHIIMRREI